MPLVASSHLPTFDDLRALGEVVLTEDQARTQDIRELHIGLLNMMPDSALQVTEQQFMRLIGGANAIVQIHVHVFTVPGLDRGADARDHIARHYESFDDLRRDGLDALVVTGANVSNPRLEDEPFWEPLAEVMAWADEHVTSTLCSCLSTHALVQARHGVHRRRLQDKRWGVYPHRLVDPSHPLLRGTNTRFDVPHSRWNEITSDELSDAGVRVLVESLAGDFHLGTSPDGLRSIYMQGHPEYDTISLLKEFKREALRYLGGELEGVPPLPANSLDDAGERKARAWLRQASTARDRGAEVPEFPERALAGHLHNTWTDTGRALFNNWLGLVYRLTDVRRGVPFTDGVDPDHPLSSLGSGL